MKTVKTHRACVILLICGIGLVLLVCSSRSVAYVEVPYTLGRVIAESNIICVMKVEKVDKEKNLIIFRKVQDLKGKHPGDVIKHNIGRGGFHPREWQFTMEWAEAGKTAVFFHNGGASETCIHNYWYQAYNGGEWWNMSHAEPYLLRSFAGNPDKLASAVTAILAGQEVSVPCMVDGDKNTLQLRTGKIQRLKASLKLQDYNPQRDFAGWGGEDFRLLAGMPAFSHYAALARVDPGVTGITSADFDGDGKPDLCLTSENRVVLLQNAGTSFNEIALPLTGGARAAVWLDFNGDKNPDLFLATPAGPKLLMNHGGSFKDETALLPSEPYHNLTAAVSFDYDGDGLQDLLVANGFLGLRMYRNLGKATPSAAGPQSTSKWFEDVSAKVGLGPDGVGGSLRGHGLTSADVNGDGRTDFLYSGGASIMVLNTPQGFVAAGESGVTIELSKNAPSFVDFNNDRAPDLLVPTSNGCKLFQNDGKGRFFDVTSRSGDLAKLAARVACVACADFDRDGKPDLMVGCLQGPNRQFRNLGDGSFVEVTESAGLHQRVFNTRAILALDLNKDSALDIVMNNEGVESGVLLGKTAEKISGPTQGR